MQTIPVTILTGFLGAGKTTLLNRIIHGEHGRRVAVLVNDFGMINIDSQLVVDVEGDMISLSNGCICCTIRGDFVAAVEQVASRADAPDYIVVEASGVSDPIDIGLTFQSIPKVYIDSILAVIDAEQIQSLSNEFAVLAMNQIGVADIVVVNKIDLVTPEQLEAVRGYIRKIARDARVFETSHADVPLELVLGVGRYDISRLTTRAPHDIHVHSTDDHHTHAHDHDHSMVFSTWNWVSGEPVSLRALQRVLDQLPTSVYRGKGIFFTADTPDQRVVVQMVGRRVMVTMGAPWENEQLRTSQFVLIAAHGALDPDALQAQFEASLAKNAPRSELDRLARTVMRWLRPG